MGNRQCTTKDMSQLISRSLQCCAGFSSMRRHYCTLPVVYGCHDLLDRATGHAHQNVQVQQQVPLVSKDTLCMHAGLSTLPSEV
jgi:hypothetical protein